MFETSKCINQIQKKWSDFENESFLCFVSGYTLTELNKQERSEAKIISQSSLYILYGSMTFLKAPGKPGSTLPLNQYSAKPTSALRSKELINRILKFAEHKGNSLNGKSN